MGAAPPSACAPMSAITNAFNLDHDGLYKELQSVAPGATWKESFWLSVG